MKKKKVLHIINSLELGGAEKLLVTVINRIGDEYEQHLIVLRKPVTLLPQLTTLCKVTVLDFGSYFSLLPIIRKVKKYIVKNDIDIVHAQLYWSGIVSRLAAKRNVKVFNTIQAISSEASYKFSKTILYLEKITYRKRHHIIGVSEEVLKDFDKWVGLKGPSTVLYNVIGDQFFAERPKTIFSENQLRMVAVGNLRWQKNYPYAIEAFKRMPPNVSLDIYGEGDQRAELQEQIDTHKLNIRLCGHHHNLENVLPGYDVVLMPSLYEGFSLGLMEAMACGLPPILSDIPVLREAALEHGIYVDLNNPDSLVDKAKQILEKKIDLPVLSAHALKRANEVARVDSHVKKLYSLYEESLPPDKA
jgi:glycosyltransferase involved in cell wall biosynthesis